MLGTFIQYTDSFCFCRILAYDAWPDGLCLFVPCFFQNASPIRSSWSRVQYPTLRTEYGNQHVHHKSDRRCFTALIVFLKFQAFTEPLAGNQIKREFLPPDVGWTVRCASVQGKWCNIHVSSDPLASERLIASCKIRESLKRTGVGNLSNLPPGSRPIPTYMYQISSMTFWPLPARSSHSPPPISDRTQSPTQLQPHQRR
jgi:hypothetical protein